MNRKSPNSPQWWYCDRAKLQYDRLMNSLTDAWFKGVSRSTMEYVRELARDVPAARCKYHNEGPECYWCGKHVSLRLQLLALTLTRLGVWK